MLLLRTDWCAVALLDSIRPYVDWQTTVQWIKNPPPEYAEKVQAPYDFWAEFESIYQRTKNGEYLNEYEFGFDLYTCFQQTHDGHFVIYPDSVNRIFAFGRTTPLVSISKDGTSIPEVYVYSDVLEATASNASFTPSPLTMIDGQNSTEYLLNWAQYGSLQDKDALWNNMFYLLATVSLGAVGSGTGTFSGGGRGRWIYPGESTTLTFANGSEITNENFARVLVPFDNITSGPDIYKEYFAVPAAESVEEIATSTTSSISSASSTTSSTAASTTVPAPGFPLPVIRQKNNLNSGYFLEGPGYDDVAVLSVASFVGSEVDEVNFQEVNTYLIDRAKAENKTKLIIDVSANGGGTILQGYDLFKQLFPQILPYGANRFRAHEAFNLIGQEVSEFAGRIGNRSLQNNETTLELLSTSWNYRTDVDVDYKDFDSWPDKYGPETFGPGPDNYTNLLRWNMTDTLTTENSGGIYVSGYLNRSNITVQPFDANNIVIVTDGYCASTCTIFSELMRQQAGIKTIILGGRPNKDIAQAVGGVKGTNSYPFSYILSGASIPFQYEYIHSSEYYNTTALGKYNDLVLYRAVSSVTNARDGFRQNDTSNIPLHFQYEPADCRIYYTPQMAIDQTATWKTVADSAFNGVNHCVAGGFGDARGYIGQKRDLIGRKQHPVRRDLDTEVHRFALKNVWTGSDGVTLGGDSVMIP